MSATTELLFHHLHVYTRITQSDTDGEDGGLKIAPLHVHTIMYNKQKTNVKDPHIY